MLALEPQECGGLPALGKGCGKCRRSLAWLRHTATDQRAASGAAGPAQGIYLHQEQRFGTPEAGARRYLWGMGESLPSSRGIRGLCLWMSYLPLGCGLSWVLLRLSAIGKGPWAAGRAAAGQLASRISLGPLSFLVLLWEVRTGPCSLPAPFLLLPEVCPACLHPVSRPVPCVCYFRTICLKGPVLASAL